MQPDFIEEKGHHNLRKFRCSMPEHCYFLTICTYGKEKNLQDSDIAEMIFDSLDFLENSNKILLICCIIMPKHIHSVFQLKGSAVLSDTIHSFKRFTAIKINKHLGRSGQFWQDQYYEHRIRQEEDLMKIVGYCRENPMRRGLTMEPESYQFWKFKPENI